ncbi:MAG: NIPSNAP family protein [Burkholderiales bacterium]
MIVDEHIYTFYPGKLEEFLRMYEQEGLEIQTRILGNLIGYFTTDIGPMNQIVHLWGFADYGDREKRRVELLSNPVWKAYLPKVRALMCNQETKMLRPTKFSPIR